MRLILSLILAALIFRLMAMPVFDAIVETIACSLFAIPCYFWGGAKSLDQLLGWLRMHPRSTVLIGLGVIASIFQTLLYFDSVAMVVPNAITVYFFLHGVYASLVGVFSLIVGKAGRR